MLESLICRPPGQIRVVSLSGNYERRVDADLLSPILPKYSFLDHIPGLRLNRNVAIGTVLSSQFRKEQAQKMICLRHCRYGAFSAAPAGTLLDRHRRRNAKDPVNIRSGDRLHELPGIGVEGFQVTALPLGEEDIKGYRALPASADSGYDRKTIPGN